jgi:hypothetical protein
LESFLSEAIDECSKTVQRCDRGIDECEARLDEFDTVLNEQADMTHLERLQNGAFEPAAMEWIQHDIDKYYKVRENAIDNAKQSSREITQVRKSITKAHYELANRLCSILEPVGLVQLAKRQWGNDRSSLWPEILRWTHRMATSQHPFVARYIEEEWQENDEAYRLGERKPYNDSEIRSAIDEYEVCHWNRRVAEQDFLYMRDLRGRDNIETAWYVLESTLPGLL